MMRISEVFIKISDAARESDRPAPVIVTDMFTAGLLCRLLEDDLGIDRNALRTPCRGIGMYDGVLITHPGWPLPEGWPSTSIHAWREHFGPLAEAFS